MLTRKLLALTILGAMVAAPLVAMAAPGDHPSGRAADAQARHEALTSARQAAMSSFHENRSAIIEAYKADLMAIKDSFLENKSRVLTECRGVHNETFEHTNKSDLDRENKTAWAKCVHDGLAPLRDDARADARDAFHDALRALHDAAVAAIQEFRHHRSEITGEPEPEEAADDSSEETAADDGADDATEDGADDGSDDAADDTADDSTDTTSGDDTTGGA
ncbi:MAG TPA: hypothetical protein VGR28_14205 [Candidatus Thermoplasmatota archaeon]|jgi:hypothetical protein|nr:hypothetical protein [Candidatus Thermoplasmatota archaeon]